MTPRATDTTKHLRCQQPTKSGGQCRNSVSFAAAPYSFIATKDTPERLLICGTHANTLYLAGWTIADLDWPIAASERVS